LLSREEDEKCFFLCFFFFALCFLLNFPMLCTLISHEFFYVCFYENVFLNCVSIYRLFIKYFTFILIFYLLISYLYLPIILSLYLLILFLSCLGETQTICFYFILFYFGPYFFTWLSFHSVLFFIYFFKCGVKICYDYFLEQDSYREGYCYKSLLNSFGRNQ
jgi:hypothetical protein